MYSRNCLLIFEIWPICSFSDWADGYNNRHLLMHCGSKTASNYTKLLLLKELLNVNSFEYIVSTKQHTRSKKVYHVWYHKINFLLPFLYLESFKVLPLRSHPRTKIIFFWTITATPTSATSVPMKSEWINKQVVSRSDTGNEWAANKYIWTATERLQDRWEFRHWMKYVGDGKCYNGF